MPEVGKEIIVRIDFPEYPENDPGWVEIIANPNRKIFLENENTNLDRDSVIISKVIRKWNFTKNGETLPTTPENVDACLALVDRMLILDALGLGKLLTDVKKNNSPSSSSISKEAPPGNTLT